MIKIILLNNNGNILFIEDLLCSHFHYLEKIKNKAKILIGQNKCHRILIAQKVHAGHIKSAK